MTPQQFAQTSLGHLLEFQSGKKNGDKEQNASQGYMSTYLTDKNEQVYMKRKVTDSTYCIKSLEKCFYCVMRISWANHLQEDWNQNSSLLS